MLKQFVLLLLCLTAQWCQAQAQSHLERFERVTAIQEAQRVALAARWQDHSKDPEIGQDLAAVQRILISSLINARKEGLSEEVSKSLAVSQDMLNKIREKLAIRTCQFKGTTYKAGQSWFENNDTTHVRVDYVCKEDGTISESRSCQSGFFNSAANGQLICTPVKDLEPCLLLGNCVEPIEPIFPNPRACLPGYVWNGMRCVRMAPVVLCPIGTIRTSSGCVSIVDNPECAEGTFWNGRTCEPMNVDPLLCPVGTIRTSSGCKLTIQNPECPEGTSWNGRTCKPWHSESESKSCPDGMIKFNNRCIAIQ